MPEPTDLTKTSEVWKFTGPPPSRQTIYLEVTYGQTPDDTIFTALLDDIYDPIQIPEPTARAITAALDELHKRLMIPEGETQC